MKVSSVRVQNFRNVVDSDEFSITDLTCLVGKNEAGKTAILQALYRLNPYVANEGTFDVTTDYPKNRLVEYEDELEDGGTAANVVTATFALEDADLNAIANLYGPSVVTAKTFTVSKNYDNKRTFSLKAPDELTAVKGLVATAPLDSSIKNLLSDVISASETLSTLDQFEGFDKTPHSVFYDQLKRISESDVSSAIYNGLLKDRLPKFLYFDDYYQMSGKANLNALKNRIAEGTLRPSDHPLLGLINLAGLTLDDLIEAKNTESLISKIESAESRLSHRVLKHWTQNRHLRLKFDVRAAKEDDPEGMREGTNILGRVTNTRHNVSTDLGGRSRGFLWFFSFLSWYSDIRKRKEQVILLLDEPGISLHAKAQADLLQYFENELITNHQVIYSTHSPFMVDAKRFDRVRIVEDKSLESDSIDESHGTTVTEDVLGVGEDSLFPLQHALGYDIYQTLFIGPNSLVVEGVSDLLYLQMMSLECQIQGRVFLNPDWVITPVGGAGNVGTFAAIIGAQSKLHVAVLLDYTKKDEQAIEQLYKRKLLKKEHVFTYNDFVNGKEADVEDMFNPGTYLKMYNGALNQNIKVADLPNRHRIVERLRSLTGSDFNHYSPARFAVSSKFTFSPTELDRWEALFKDLNAAM